MFFKNKKTGEIVDAIVTKRQMALEGQVIEKGTIMYWEDIFYISGPIEFNEEYELLENQNEGFEALYGGTEEST